jgi:hypothetical protein
MLSAWVRSTLTRNARGTEPRSWPHDGRLRGFAASAAFRLTQIARHAAGIMPMSARSPAHALREGRHERAAFEFKPRSPHNRLRNRPRHPQLA